MEALGRDYASNVALLRRALRTDENFDMLVQTVRVGEDELTGFYIDGFTDGAVTQRVIQYFMSQKGLPASAEEFATGSVPHAEVSRESRTDALILAVLSGQSVWLGSTFGGAAVIVDTRAYPARETAEPESDRVMQGAHDGFVETLLFNTALIRRRLRDTRLTMSYFNAGGASATDIVLCYLDGVADEKYVRLLRRRLSEIRPQSLTLGCQSLCEVLIPRRWYNPFPKVRMLERPDAAAAELCEGRVLVLCDTSPQVMALPTSIFDFMQETDDFYFPPLTGSYLRVLRNLVLLMSLVLTPLWYLAVSYADLLPAMLRFVVPTDPGELPVLLQLLLAEFAVDGLKLASMNTPGMLSNSLSVIGGLILGDFAVGVGWFCPDVILYTAIVAIASFTQQNHELGFSIKFMRMTTLITTALFNIAGAGGWGFFFGMALTLIALCTNTTLNGERRYLYPLIPFDGGALLRLFFRLPKKDTGNPAAREAEKNQKSA